MNRSQYLMALYDALEGLPNEVRAEAVDEYREYFRIEVEKGRTEEEISLSLGDPITLAYAIKQRRGFGTDSHNEPKKRRHKSKSTLWAVISVVMALAIGGSIINSVSHGFSRFGFGKKYPVDELKQIDHTGATAIEILSISTNTIIEASNNNLLEASLKGQVRTNNPDYVPKLEVKRSGDTIIIEEKRTTRNISGFSSNNIKLTVAIPEDFSGKISFKGASGNLNAENLELNDFDISLSSGNINVEEIRLVNDLVIACASGNISVDGLLARNAFFKSTSGNKTLDDLSVSEDVSIDTASGDNKLDTVQCTTLKIESVSGKNSIADCKVDLIDINTRSGNVTVEDLEGAATIKSTAGEIDVQVKSAKGEYNLSALSGNISLSLPANTGFKLVCNVSSGDIKCDFNLMNEFSDRRSLKGIYGSGEIPVNLNTSAGNINIISD